MRRDAWQKESLQLPLEFHVYCCLPLEGCAPGSSGGDNGGDGGGGGGGGGGGEGPLPRWREEGGRWREE